MVPRANDARSPGTPPYRLRLDRAHGAGRRGAGPVVAAQQHPSPLSAGESAHRGALPSPAASDRRSPCRTGSVIMTKEALLTLEGEIDEIMPDGRFGVMSTNRHRIFAYTAVYMRRFRIRSVVGDRVHVEMTPYDLTKGRIIFRERTPGQGTGARRGGFRR